jgi:hypothetical protein
VSLRAKFKGFYSHRGGPFLDNIDNVCFMKPLIVREYLVDVVSFIANKATFNCLIISWLLLA